jgi:hypothetical protein
MLIKRKILINLKRKNKLYEFIVFHKDDGNDKGMKVIWMATME